MWRSSFRYSVEEGKERSYNLISSTLQLKQKYEWDSQESGHAYICQISSYFCPLFNEEYFLWTFSFSSSCLFGWKLSILHGGIVMNFEFILFHFFILYFCFMFCHCSGVPHWAFLAYMDVVDSSFPQYVHIKDGDKLYFLPFSFNMLKAIVCAFPRGFISFDYLNMTYASKENWNCIFFFWWIVYRGITYTIY